MPIIKNCLKCGKEFETYPSKIKIGHGKYCSLGCKPAHNKGKATSEEAKQKISKANKGKIRSSEIKKEMSRTRKGSKNSHWKGGIVNEGNGYIYIYAPDHPFRNTRNYVYEHRLVMEKHLGRYLTSKEIVHHRGIKYPIGSIENKQDNRTENLQLFASSGKHTAFHFKLNKTILDN